MITILRGTIVSAPAFGQLEIHPRGYLAAKNGRITGVYDHLPEELEGVPVEDFGQCLITQSFADLHLHAPQYPMMATGMDLPLMDWLESYALPAEAQFADPDYAREMYRRLARELIQGGTTRVCIFSSLHRPATLILMDELERAGITGYAGKVNMDCGSSRSLQETTEESCRETLQWLEECEDFFYIKPILTPRFTPSCSPELLGFLGKLALDRKLPVQSHLSENTDEMRHVRELHPDCGQYWQTYEKYGLWTKRTIMAHCVWSDPQEQEAMARQGVTAIHCAASNINLCSGVAPVKAMLRRGVKVALGSDVAGGETLSMFDVTADTIRASKTRRIMDNWETDFLTVPEAWYLATSAGAAYFGAKPGLAVGQPLHALVLDDSALPPLSSPEDRLARCVYRRQRDAVRAVWSEGRRVFSAD